MAPRKSAAAVGKELGPTLTLVMEKGPLSGQVKDFRPGSLVHIGRVVRGNTLCIKDVGISSKHLLIQFDSASDPDSRRWTITDLGSSNGTVLNGEMLDPSKPVALSDGDIVKIGEQTSIMVKIEVRGAEDEIEATSGNARRNARRRVREHVVDLVVIEEDAELGLRNDEDEKEIEEVDAIKVKQGRNVNTRNTRNSAKNGSLANDLNVEVVGPSDIKGVNTRRTRNAKKEKDIEEDAGPSEITESRVSTRRTRNAMKEQDIEENAGPSEITESRVSTIRTRNAKKKKDIEEVTGPSEITEPRVSTRRTRNAKKDENVDDIAVNMSAIEGNKMTRGGRGRKKQPVETISEETQKEEPILDHKTCEEEKEISEVRVDKTGEEVKSSGTEGVAAGFTSSSGVKEGKAKMAPDLKNMTLGEWLDFLYVHEPQEIIDRTEEMLAEMRRKAERCHEFRLQQKNAKAVE